MVWGKEAMERNDQVWQDSRTWLAVACRCGVRQCSVANIILEKSGLTLARLNALATIHERKEVTMSDISREQGITMGAGTNLIDSLLDAGYVARRRDTKDRRVVKVKLTPEGVEMLERSTDALCEFWSEVLAQLPPEERTQFFRTYGKVLDRADAVWSKKEPEYRSGL